MLLLASLVAAFLPLCSATLILSTEEGAGEANPAGAECTAEQQVRILPELIGCEPHPTLVELELPNASYVHVMPRHVVVDKCGGSCISRYHRCLPSSIQQKSVEALLIQHSSSAGATPSECAVTSVEEHMACTCGCAISVEECSPAQLFMDQECRCVCADDSARATCLSEGRYWNPVSCSCMCRNPSTFPTCPTGYYFDSDNSCTCVLLGESASTVLEILLLVLVSSCLLMAYGSFHMYHRHLRENNFDMRRTKLGESISELRTLFTQNSRHPSGTDSTTGAGGGGGVVSTGGVGSEAAAAGSSSSTSFTPGPIRPRASTFSFFSFRGYEEIQEEEGR